MNTIIVNGKQKIVLRQVWIGDLCYVSSDEKWSQMCDTMQKNDNWDELLVPGESALHGTAHGDGRYFGLEDPRSLEELRLENDDIDTSPYLYGVDSGTLGVIWFDKITKPEGIPFGQIFDVEYDEDEGEPLLSVAYDLGIIDFYIGTDLIEQIDTSGDDDWSEYDFEDEDGFLKTDYDDGDNEDEDGFLKCKQ